MQLVTQALAETEPSVAPQTVPAPQPVPVPAPAPQPAAPVPAPQAVVAPTPATAPKTATTAQAPAPQSAGGAQDALIEQLQAFVPFLAILAIVYFIVLRPQQRAQKEAQNQLRNVRRGDVVATSGGLIGKVSKAIDDNEVEIELGPNMRVRLLRTAITEVRAKGEPVKDAPAAKPSPASKTPPASRTPPAKT